MNDLLVTIVGAKTGDVCRVPLELTDHYICQSVALLRPVLATCSRFLELYLASLENGRIEWDNNLDQLDENFLCAIEQPKIRNADSFEIGYPEKLTNIVSEWSVSVATRCGRLNAHRSPLTDAELMALAQAISGGSHFFSEKRLHLVSRLAGMPFEKTSFQ